MLWEGKFKSNLGVEGFHAHKMIVGLTSVQPDWCLPTKLGGLSFQIGSKLLDGGVLPQDPVLIALTVCSMS